MPAREIRTDFDRPTPDEIAALSQLPVASIRRRLGRCGWLGASGRAGCA